MDIGSFWSAAMFIINVSDTPDDQHIIFVNNIGIAS